MTDAAKLAAGESPALVAADVQRRTGQLTFEQAEHMATQHGLPSWLEWRGNLERRYNVMPL
jgi:hypothetical protein